MISSQKSQILYTYDNPIIWNITGFGNIEQMSMLNRCIEIFKKHNIDIPFSTIHGSFPCKYNGGRLSKLPDDISILKNFKNIDKYIKKYNDLGIGIKLTFSNTNIHKEQFEEKEMRSYLDLLNEHKGISNGIICADDGFAELLKKNYPDLDVVASYVKMELETKLGITDTVDYYNSQFDLYDVVVMNAYRAFDDDFLSKITHPEKVEFIVNHCCGTNCPYGAEHHKHNETIQQININVNYDASKLKDNYHYQQWLDKLDKINNKCFMKFNTLEKIKYQYLNIEEINYLSNTFGINRFKIEGRDYSFEQFAIDLNKYIINPQGPFRYLLESHIRNVYNDNNNYINNNYINKKHNILPNKIKLY